MIRVIDNPYIVFALSLAVQCVAAYLGDLLRRKVRPVAREGQADFDIVLSATLTLLALIIGFTFAMAVSRYDQRKNLEAEEANAIGTEYVRADLLPAQDQAKVRDLLGRYVDQRIQYYRAVETTAASSDSVKLQAQLWSSVVPVGIAQPTPVVALVISGMNDVLNSQGYSRAAHLNRIPSAAWALLASIAIFANMLLGYRERRTDWLVLVVLPLTVSIALFLISDIDTPHGGVIRVVPTNLVSLSQVIHAR
jgi:hypothetical protein